MRNKYLFFILSFSVLFSTCVTAKDKEKNIITAATEGDFATVKKLYKKVDDKGTKEEIYLHSQPNVEALAEASKKGYLDIVKFLVEKGVDLNRTAGDDRTPLMYATIRKQYPVIEYLLEKGANVNVHDYLGTTPLIIACIRNDKKIIELLIKYGADVNGKDSKGVSPISTVAFYGHKELFDYFIEKGADIYGTTAVRSSCII